MEIYTIGHSNRGMDEFIELLQSHQINVLADVRQFPGSRKFPHFNSDPLKACLETVHIQYVHFKELGGRRRPRPDSQNHAWRNEAFRGYADYMETEEFENGIRRLLQTAGSQRLCMMCSEALWWQCHRSLISDYLKSTGISVFHIQSKTKAPPHEYTEPARIIEGKLSYRTLL